jgi:hypothetical protein
LCLGRRVYVQPLTSTDMLPPSMHVCIDEHEWTDFKNFHMSDSVFQTTAGFSYCHGLF